MVWHVNLRYGSRCYRTNPVHKREYSHSGALLARWAAGVDRRADPCFAVLVCAASEDDSGDDDSDDEGVDARNIVQGRRKRQRVNYAEDSDSEFDPDDE